MRLLLSFSFVALFIFEIAAQNAEADLRLAKTRFKQHYYSEALPLLEAELGRSGDRAELNYMLGVCYLNCYSQEKGLLQMKKAYEADSLVDKDVLFWMGRAYHLNYDFVNAQTYYEKYLKTLKPGDSNVEVVNRAIEEVTNGLSLYKMPMTYEIRSVGRVVNSPYAEHSPVVSADGTVLYFTSRMGDSASVRDADGEFAEDIYVSYRDSLGQWTKPMIASVNTSANDATVQLYRDSLFLLYRDTAMGDIYQSTINKKGTKWSSPKPVDFINSSASESSAFISADESMVFIVSDRDSHHGDLDIFVSKKGANGEYGPFKNMGPKINTSYDENSPVLSWDGRTLFFSSMGHNSMGGYDIFKTEYDSTSDAWSDPVSLGYPMNTPGDDLYLTFSNSNLWTGYFSSYRNGGEGEKDIYEVIFIPNVYIYGEVLDQQTKLPLDSVELTFYLVNQDQAYAPLMIQVRTKGDPAKYKVNLLANEEYRYYVVRSKDTLDQGTYVALAQDQQDAGRYAFTVKVSVAKDGANQTSANPLVQNAAAPVYLKGDPGKQPSKQGGSTSTPVPTGSTSTPDPNLPKKGIVIPVYSNSAEYFGINEVLVGCGGVLRSLYFEFNSAVIEEEKSKADLDNLLCFLKENPGVTLEIGGHTDNVGSSYYNKTLSQKRAEAVVKYLIKQGVDAKRLVAVGYGETMPIASNDDEEEGRELNRRTTFKVIAKK